MEEDLQSDKISKISKKEIIFCNIIHAFYKKYIPNYCLWEISQREISTTIRFSTHVSSCMFKLKYSQSLKTGIKKAFKVQRNYEIQLFIID